MPFILALLMSACAAVSAYGGDFNELDALLREDARLKMELAEERAKFADEERMLDAEISASEALVSELKKKQIPSKKGSNPQQKTMPRRPKKYRGTKLPLALSPRCSTLYILSFPKNFFL